MTIHNKTVPSNTTPSSATLPKRASSNTNETSSNINGTAHLTIRMTIETKSRKKTIYRVAQRPDGVLVEKPRYRPSSNGSAPAGSKPIFKRIPQILVLDQGRIKDMRSNREVRMSDDLRGVGAFAGRNGNTGRGGRDEYKGIFEGGRGGYNDVFGRGTDGYQGPVANLMRRSEAADPMQRFLAQSDPWSTQNRRNAIISDKTHI